MEQKSNNLFEDISGRFAVRASDVAGQSRVGFQISEGQRIAKAGPNFLYEFSGSTKGLPACDDVDIRVKYKGVVTEGVLVGRTLGSFFVILSRDIGIATQSAVLYVDSTKLFEKRKRFFDQQRRLSVENSGHLGLKVLGMAPLSPTSWHSTSELESGLSTDEAKIIKSLRKRSISLLDSPSSARRRRILSHVVARLVDADKRVLVVAPRHHDVEMLLSHISRRSGIRLPSIIRLGPPIVGLEGRRGVQDQFDLESVAARTNAAALEALAALRTATQADRATLRRIERVLCLYTELRETRTIADRLQQDLKPHECRLQDFQRELSKANAIVEEASAALERAKRISIVRRVAEGLKPPHLLQRLRSVDGFRRRVRGQIEILDKSVSQKRAEFEEARQTVWDLERLVEGVSESELRELYDQLDVKLRSDLGDIERLEREFSANRQSLLENAKVVFGTFDQLSDTDVPTGSFDVVILESVGEDMLDLVFSLAGLSRDRLVVSGRLSATHTKKRGADALSGTLLDAYRWIRGAYPDCVTPKLLDLRIKSDGETTKFMVG